MARADRPFQQVRVGVVELQFGSQVVHDRGRLDAVDEDLVARAIGDLAVDRDLDVLGGDRGAVRVQQAGQELDGDGQAVLGGGDGLRHLQLRDAVGIVPDERALGQDDGVHGHEVTGLGDVEGQDRTGAGDLDVLDGLDLALGDGAGGRDQQETCGHQEGAGPSHGRSAGTSTHESSSNRDLA